VGGEPRCAHDPAIALEDIPRWQDSHGKHGVTPLAAVP
jgi:hypothetical protein